MPQGYCSPTGPSNNENNALNAFPKENGRATGASRRIRLCWVNEMQHKIKTFPGRLSVVFGRTRFKSLFSLWTNGNPRLGGVRTIYRFLLSRCKNNATMTVWHGSMRKSFAWHFESAWESALRSERVFSCFCTGFALYLHVYVVYSFVLAPCGSSAWFKRNFERSDIDTRTQPPKVFKILDNSPRHTYIQGDPKVIKQFCEVISGEPLGPQYYIGFVWKC